MEDIRIITDKGELEGTCYVEILPGAYKKQCWNDGSLFFDEEVFGYIESTIERRVAGYDHYAFTEIEKENCLSIADDLDRLAARVTAATSLADLENHVGFLFKGTDERFAAEFEVNKDALAQLATQFSLWLRTTAGSHGRITVLGI